jgi:hypothetical protein
MIPAELAGPSPPKMPVPVAVVDLTPLRYERIDERLGALGASIERVD